jgi:hypothetical protein
MNFLHLVKPHRAWFLTSFLLSSISLNLLNIAEARTIHSSSYFVGKYKNKAIYGIKNEWDGRACTVLNNNVAIGIVINDDKILFSGNREVKITNSLLLNPYGSGQIPVSWRDNPSFGQCYNKMLYAQCFVREGVKYYKTEDEKFRGVTKTRRRVFSIGTMTNSYTRDEGNDSLEWASFSFDNPDDNSQLIINYKDLDCKNKLK